MSVYFRFYLIGLMGTLSGCDNTQDTASLNAYLQAVLARPGQAVAPVPSVRPVRVADYGAAGLRNPFQALHESSAASWQVSLAGDDGDESRVKVFLEGMDLEQFEMVGTLSNSEGANALLRLRGVVHRLKVGDYLGRNNGQIAAIDTAHVEVFEVISDGRGGWLERTLAIPLKQQS